jgi:DNA transformation protein and related proteins
VSADLKALAAMPSLGQASARMLAEVGVATPAQLKELGPAAAYRRLRFAFGKRAPATYLYALDIACRGAHWRDMSAARMARLRAEALRIQAEVSGGSGPPSRKQRKEGP